MLDRSKETTNGYKNDLYMFNNWLITLKAAAAPAVITELDSSVRKSIINGLSQSIKGQDLVIKDQYGRVMTDSAVNTWLNVAGNSIVLTSSKDSVTDKSPFTVTTNAVGSVDAAKQIITASTDSFTLTARTLANLNNTEKVPLHFQLMPGFSIVCSGVLRV